MTCKSGSATEECSVTSDECATITYYGSGDGEGGRSAKMHI